ncbi:hypothetical protein ACFV2X_51620, partial [Streptomyces sp. NPDC059679]|uniref:hypothetical protein n=1 Tax=Streptomyces sp. NPDC059679 TaxID=3346903 RepID=UPI0036B79526
VRGLRLHQRLQLNPAPTRANRFGGLRAEAPHPAFVAAFVAPGHEPGRSEGCAPGVRPSGSSNVLPPGDPHA